MLPQKKKPLFAAMLLVLALSVTGCATSCVPQTPNSPTPPERPSLSEPLPLTTYSSNASANTQAWRKKLIDTPLTPESSTTPGP